MVFKVSQADKYTVFRIPVQWHHFSKVQDKQIFSISPNGGKTCSSFTAGRDSPKKGFDLKFLPNTCTNMCYRCSFHRFWYVKFVVFSESMDSSNRKWMKSAQSLYNWVGFHPRYTLNNQGFFTMDGVKSHQLP